MDPSSDQYICAVLRKLGIESVTIDFDGSGDSGDIHGIQANGLFDELQKYPVADLPILTHGGNEVCWPHCNKNKSMMEKNLQTYNNMQDWVQDWVMNNILSILEYDWVNNDGGGGTITIEPAIDTITLEGYWNEQVQHPVEWVRVKDEVTQEGNEEDKENDDG